MPVHLHIVVRQGVDEVHLIGDVGEQLGAGLEHLGQQLQVDVLPLAGLADVGQGLFQKLVHAQLSDVGAVDGFQLLGVEDGGGLADARHVKLLSQFLQGEDFVFSLGSPAQQGDVVHHRFGEVALGNQIFKGSVPVALRELVGGVLHHRGAVDVHRDVPAEGLIQQVVLGGGGKVLVAPDDMGDAHGVVVHHVGEVVGGHAVGLNQNLVVQGGVVHRDGAEDGVLKGGGAFPGTLLPDDVGNPSGQLFLHLFLGQVAAVAVVHGRNAAGLLDLPQLGEPVFVAEAVVGVAAFHQLLGVFLKHPHALTLDVGTHRAAHVGAFVPVQAGLAQGVVDDVYRPFHIPFLVGVLNAEDEGAVVLFRQQIGV